MSAELDEALADGDEKTVRHLALKTEGERDALRTQLEDLRVELHLMENDRDDVAAALALGYSAQGLTLGAQGLVLGPPVLVIPVQDGEVLQPWTDAHRRHGDEPYLGCPF